MLMLKFSIMEGYFKAAEAAKFKNVQLKCQKQKFLTFTAIISFFYVLCSILIMEFNLCTGIMVITSSRKQDFC
jgi:hypothetical protein